MITQKEQMDDVLKEGELCTPPERAYGKRINTPGETKVLDSYASNIESQKQGIQRVETENGKLKNQVSTIKDDITKRTSAHNEEVQTLVNKNIGLKKKLLDLYNKENFLRTLFPTFNISTPLQDGPSNKKKGSGIWLLLLVTFGLEAITFAATYSLQLEALSMMEVFMRFLYVIAIFGISVLLHFLHTRSGNKIVLAMLIATISLSIVTMFHVVYFSLNVPESLVATGLSFNAEQTVRTTDSFFKKLMANPGLIELMAAAVFCTVGVICHFFGGKTDKKSVNETPHEEKEDTSFHVQRLAQTTMEIQKTKETIEANQIAINECNSNFNYYVQHNIQTLGQIKAQITANEDEKGRLETLLNETMRMIFQTMCENRLMRIDLYSSRDNIPASEVTYEEWCLEDIITHYN